jgi:serine/threonine protein kinase
MGAVKITQETMMVMEYMHFGSLYDILRNESVLLEDRLLVNTLIEVASGLRFLHSSKPHIVHGDLKCKNILVDERFRAKVADFGLAPHKGYFGNKKATGTPLWMAPELIRGVSGNTPESDMV